MITITSVANPVYTRADESCIDVTVTFKEYPGTHQFHATWHDSEPHGQELFNDLKAGKYGPIAPYVFDPVSAALDIRTQRNFLISQTDWTQGIDIPTAAKEKWEPYRQALRDVPQQSTFPGSVIWPTPPN